MLLLLILLRDLSCIQSSFICIFISKLPLSPLQAFPPLLPRVRWVLLDILLILPVRVSLAGRGCLLVVLFLSVVPFSVMASVIPDLLVSFLLNLQQSCLVSSVGSRFCCMQVRMFASFAIWDERRMLSRWVTALPGGLGECRECSSLRWEAALESSLCEASLSLLVFFINYCTRSAVSSCDLSTLLTYRLTAFASALLLASLPQLSMWMAWLIVHFLNIRLAPSPSTCLGIAGATCLQEDESFFLSISCLRMWRVCNLWSAMGGRERLRLSQARQLRTNCLIPAIVPYQSCSTADLQPSFHQRRRMCSTSSFLPGQLRLNYYSYLIYLWDFTYNNAILSNYNLNSKGFGSFPVSLRSPLAASLRMQSISSAQTASVRMSLLLTATVAVRSSSLNYTTLKEKALMAAAWFGCFMNLSYSSLSLLRESTSYISCA